MDTPRVSARIILFKVPFHSSEFKSAAGYIRTARHSAGRHFLPDSFNISSRKIELMRVW